MTEILEIRMSVSAATGRIINGIDPIDNYDKVSYILKNAVDYTYDESKSLADNVKDYYTKRGYPAFENVCTRFNNAVADWLKRDGSLYGIDVGKTAVLLATVENVPLNLDIEIK